MKSSWTTGLLLASIIYLANGQEQSDIYKGGIREIYTLVGSNLKHPVNERNMGVEGMVLFKFKIKDGNIDSLEIINSVAPNIDIEAKRVLLLTNGNWLIKSNKPILFPFVFRLDFPGRVENDELIAKRNRLLKKKKLTEALEYSEKLRQRNPFDQDNLSKLIMIYTSLNQPDHVQKIEYLKEQLQKFRVVL